MKIVGNKYDTFVILLLVSLAGGMAGGAIQVSRLVTIILFFPMLSKIRLVLDRYLYAVLLFIVLFLSWALFSFCWTPDRSTGVNDLVNLILSISYFLELIVFVRLSSASLKYISMGWIIAFIITAIIGLWELSTGNHLSFIKEATDTHNIGGGEIITAGYASSTFYNSNTYVTFICFLLPFLFNLTVLRYKTYIMNFVKYAPLLAAIYIMISNASRGGIVVLFIMTVLFYVMRLKKMAAIVTLLFIAFIIINLVINHSESFAQYIIYRFQATDSDSESRFFIWKSALEVCSDYCFIGSGIGSMEQALLNVHAPVLATHNFFIELFMQYGVFILLMFLFLIFKAYQLGKEESTEVKYLIYATIFAMPFTMIIDSGYLTSIEVWAYYATLFFLATQRTNLKCNSLQIKND